MPDPHLTRNPLRRLVAALLAVVALWLGVGAAFAQVPETADPAAAPIPTQVEEENEEEAARGLPILRIDVAGNQRVTRRDVLSYLHIRVGQPFDPDALTKDAKELWNSGFFDDIEVDLERAEGGVRLRFVVRERPNVSEVTFEGNEEIDDEDLAEAIEVKEGSILSYPAIQRTVQKIRDMYAEKGYFLAEAEFEVVPQKHNEVKIEFTIAEHEEVSVRRVSFIGNEHVPTEELRAIMATGRVTILSFGKGGPFRQDFFESDILRINALYYDRGFLNVSIHTPRIMLTPDRSGIEISVTIEEGPRYKIRKLRVFEQGADGREVEPIGGRKNLRNMVRAEEGNYFNRTELMADVEAVRSLYRDEGYANVDATPQTQIHPDTNEVDVVLPVRRGPIVYFERVVIRGNTKTRDKVIRREIEVIEGKKFSESLLNRSRERVNALGYFERVDVSTQQGSSPDKLRVNVEVIEKPTGTFQIGAGFSSIESFIATAQIQQANFLGNGWSISLNAQLSGIRQLINARFFEPYLFDTDFQLALNGYSELSAFDDFSRLRTGGNVTLGYALIQPELTAAVRYTLERNEVSTDRTSTFLSTSNPVSIFQRLPLGNLFNDGFTSSIRPSITYDLRDNRLFPTSGFYADLKSELALAAFGSENEFWKNNLVVRFYYPLILGAVFKVNANWGIVTSPRPEGVPIFARSFLGGIYDVRGFRFRSLGPRIPLQEITDPNSNPITRGANIGGNLEYYNNVEIEFPILEDVGIKGVVFFDAGNAWNLEGQYCAVSQSIQFAEHDPCFEFSRFFTTLRTSWGMGIRWFSPLGPLRFEWGFPFAPLPFEENNRFEFTIGNFF